MRVPDDDHDILVYSNLDSPSGRSGITVWASFDGGETWPDQRMVYDGGSAYSSLAAGHPDTPAEGLIFLLYERGGGIHLARFNLDWIADDADWRTRLDPPTDN